MQSDPNRKRPGENSRPISSTPVTGTPWCMVWTGDGRVFYYNPSTKHSTWVRPKDLVGRVDVDQLLRSCPRPAEKSDEAKEKKAEETASTASSKWDEMEAKTSSLENKEEPELTETKVVSEKENNTDGDDEPAPKKAKIEEVEGQGDVSVDEVSSPENIEEVADEKKNDKPQTAQEKDTQSKEIEARAAEQRATLPLEVRLKQFREMMTEKQVSAFSTWEQELHKIVFDSRYLLLASKERKVAFDYYVKERAEEERKETKTRRRQAKEQFMTFLEDVHTPHRPRLSYSEFVKKYGRDSRFKTVERSADRETYFRQHVLELKKKREQEELEHKLRLERLRDVFLDLLKEKVLDYHVSWPEVREGFERDTRFSSLNSEEKKELFRTHQKNLKAEAKERKKAKKAKKAKESEDKKSKEKMQKEASEKNDTDKEAVNCRR